MTVKRMSFRERPGPAVLRLAAPAGLGLLLGACTVGPDYQRPAAPVPVAYKEAAAKEGWQIARPADSFDRGAWWSVYTDPVLGGLELGWRSTSEGKSRFLPLQDDIASTAFWYQTEPHVGHPRLDTASHLEVV